MCFAVLHAYEFVHAYVMCVSSHPQCAPVPYVRFLTVLLGVFEQAVGMTVPLVTGKLMQIDG